MSDLNKFEERGTEITIQPEQNSFLATIERLSSRPDIDVEKIKQIMEMQEHILDRNAKQAFNAAMVRVQSAMPTIPKDLKNIQTNSMYSAYETILKHAKPVYTTGGFNVRMYEGETQKEAHIRVCADVGHEEGHTENYWTDLPLDDRGIKGTVNKTGIHAKKSSLSYGKGILMCMVFNIPTGHDVDDDGNACGSEFITSDQRIEIEEIIVNKGIDAEAFFKYMKVETTGEILSSEYGKAKNALKKAKGSK